jgi:hypothetical protein
MSYIITFNNNFFHVNKYDKYNNRVTIQIKYVPYYKTLMDYLLKYDKIEITMEKYMNYMFLLIPSLGMYLYEGKWFTKFVNTKKIKYYDIAKIIYIFYYNYIY